MQEIKQEYQISGIIAGMRRSRESPTRSRPLVEVQDCFEAARHNLEIWRVSLRGCFAHGVGHEAQSEIDKYFLQGLGAHKSEDKQVEVLGAG